MSENQTAQRQILQHQALLNKARQALRRELRDQRRSLSRLEQSIARIGLQKQLKNHSTLLFARRVVSYLPFDGEISPASLEKTLHNAEFYYPKIINYERREMRFYRTRQGARRNTLGIIEPISVGPPLPVNNVDVILLPLVGFDRKGNRLGMGAGFYDRALACRLNQARYPRPYLVGLAHHFQEVKSLNPQSWDVPLDAILTDAELITLQ